MARRRFFVQRFSEGTAVLAGEAAHHLVRVLRAEPGQVYELSDGREVYLARLERASRDSALFCLIERVEHSGGTAEAGEAAAAPRIALLVAIVKFDRFEWALEKATELGADAVVPLAAERSGKALVAAAPKRALRWRKILEASAQQARRLCPPVLVEPMRPAEAFRAATGLRVLLSERPSAAPLRDALGGPVAPMGEAAAQLSLAVGPEGGWTVAEFEAAHATGFREAALGGNVLRTETAVVAGLAAAQFYLDHRRPGISGESRI